jgi:hypothetical protein
LSRTIALDVAAPDSLEEYDSVTPRARLLDGHGDSVAATIVWSLPDSADTVALKLIDATTGRITVNHTGLTGRLLARAGSFVGNPVSIRTLAAADTLFAARPVRDSVSVTAADSLSDSLQVELADTVKSSTGGDSLTVPLGGRPVVYTITYSGTGGSVGLVTSDTTRTGVTTDTVATASSGIAFVKVRLRGPLPDSVVVTASARRAVGTPVPGSPVTFVVRFRP